jgi:hypothetical protein
MPRQEGRRRPRPFLPWVGRAGAPAFDFGHPPVCPGLLSFRDDPPLIPPGLSGLPFPPLAPSGTASPRS